MAEIVTVLKNIFDFIVSGKLDIVIGTIFTIIALVIFGYKNYKNSAHLESEIKKIRDEIITSFDNRSTFRKFHSEHDVDNYLLRKAFLAKNIKNTYISRDGDALLNDQAEDSTREVYKSFFRKNSASWTDIIGIPNIKNFRVHSFKAKEFLGANHGIYITKRNLTVIDFIILEYNSEHSDVIFGWRSNDGGGDPGVVLSSDPSIVLMFNNYFEELRKDSISGKIEVKYEIEGRGRIADKNFVDKEGVWYLNFKRDNKISYTVFCEIYWYKGRLNVTGKAIKYSEKILFECNFNKVNFTTSNMFFEMKIDSHSTNDEYGIFLDFSKLSFSNIEKIDGKAFHSEGSKYSVQGRRIDIDPNNFKKMISEHGAAEKLHGFTGDTDEV